MYGPSNAGLPRSRRKQRWLGPQQRELIRVLQQREHAVGNKVDGGLEAGDKQQEGHIEGLARRERAAFIGHLDQLRQQVVGGFALLSSMSAVR